MNIRSAIRLSAGLSLSVLFATCVPAPGQGINPRFDVTCTLPVTDAAGELLAGSNPSAGKYGMTVVPGALVQVVDAGANGEIDLPNVDGSPGGDDVLFDTSVMGQGVAPNIQRSGKFSVSFYPPPDPGKKVYVRVFNAPTLAEATHWGQSSLHTVHCCSVFDASAKGLWATTQLKGVNPLTADSDGDGHTDYEELKANTNADDSEDVLLAETFASSTVEVEGKAGRMYRLLRSVDNLSGSMIWDVVATTEVLPAPARLILSDPSPVNNPAVFYRIEVEEP